MNLLIEQAIHEKKVIEFNYGGRLRVVEPHVFGVLDGQNQILGYQIGGQSSQGNIPDWRRFDLNKMTGMKLTETFFPGVRPCPSGRHSNWDRTFALVK
ncbi:hypothetical protein [Deefgea rivuli]|uniref:hypothetical protein n=1 Tax=Deefgea rivuli TaxID=400948 RepID=UPI0004852A17|nr:hypothetical protein [Deefgea rivuli]